MTLTFDSIPQPTGFPVLGNAREWVGRSRAEDVLDRLTSQAEAHGRLVRLRLGPANLLVIADAELASKALTDERANYKGLSYILTRAVLDNVLLLNGDMWRTHRALYRNALRNVDALQPTRTLTARWIDRFAHQACHTIDLAKEIPRLIGDIVSTFVCGEAFPASLDAARARVQYELAGLGIDLIAQPWTYVSPSRWISLRGAVKDLTSHFDAIVRHRVASGDERPDVLGGFLAMHQCGELKHGVQAITEGVVNFFFTAHDVLASSTMWTLNLLARNPEAQCVRDDAALSQVLREGLRLYPGYALFGRTTQAPMHVGEHAVPSGTFVIVSPYVTHRLSKHFDEPQVFRPSRWAGFGSTPIVSSPQDQYIPFGVGPRSCLANHLAVPIMKSVLADVLGAFVLRSESREPPRVRYWGTALPRGPLSVTLERRS